MNTSFKLGLIVTMSLLTFSGTLADAADTTWEYRVVIVQGITAGGTLDRQDSGYYIDTKRTETLNQLAAEGWQVVAVIGGSATDHAVYLRRKSK